MRFLRSEPRQGRLPWCLTRQFQAVAAWGRQGLEWLPKKELQTDPIPLQ